MSTILSNFGNPVIYGSFESVYRTADIGSSMGTFVDRTTDLRSFMDTFSMIKNCRTLAVLGTLFQHSRPKPQKLQTLGEAS